MATQETHRQKQSHGAAAAPTHRTVEAVDTLKRWRNASAATAAVAAAVLPLAINAHTPDGVGITSALLVGALLALASHALRDVRLAKLAAQPDFAGLPEVARKSQRLARPRNRRALAQGLRRTAAPTQPPARLDPCPVLLDRVAPLRSELLELARELEQTPHPDPASVALIHDLLHDGASPLYNPNAPTADLQTTLGRARAGLTEAFEGQEFWNDPPANARYSDAEINAYANEHK